MAPNHATKKNTRLEDARRVAASFESIEVAQAFDALPPRPRERLLEVRRLIFETAACTPGVGPLEEALRWGEPSYLTPKTKSGTTLRIHWKAHRPDRCALYVHCQTTLLEQYRALHGAAFEFEGKRALLIPVDGPLPARALRDCIRLALTYHQRP